MRRRPTVKANEIRLKRQDHKGCFLVVEGRDDRLFFEQFVDRDACSVTVAEGKQAVAAVIEILNADHFAGVVGVIDADFDHVEGTERVNDNLITLETVDLEALQIRSSALDRVLVEFGGAKKIADFGKDVRETLLSAALPIGCLRLHSLRTEMNLTFRELKYAECIESKSLTIDVRSLVREVKNRSQRPGLQCHEVERKIETIQRSVGDLWLVCYGADMVAILAIGLRSALGTNNTKTVAPELLRSCLRLAYQWSDLVNSQLGRDIREWTARNSGFRVLSDRK